MPAMPTALASSLPPVPGTGAAVAAVAAVADPAPSTPGTAGERFSQMLHQARRSAGPDGNASAPPDAPARPGGPARAAADDRGDRATRATHNTGRSAPAPAAIGAEVADPAPHEATSGRIGTSADLAEPGAEASLPAWLWPTPTPTPTLTPTLHDNALQGAAAAGPLAASAATTGGAPDLQMPSDAEPTAGLNPVVARGGAGASPGLLQAPGLRQAPGTLARAPADTAVSPGSALDPLAEADPAAASGPADPGRPAAAAAGRQDTPAARAMLVTRGAVAGGDDDAAAGDADARLPGTATRGPAPEAGPATAGPAPLALAALAAAASPSVGAGAPMTGAATAAAEPVAREIREPLHSPTFAPALGAQLTLLVKEGVTEARLHLNPAEMGPIAVQIQVDGTQARVEMVAEQALTRQVLEQSMPALAGALRDSGLTLTGGGVFQQSARQQQPDGSPGSPSGRGAGAGHDPGDGGAGDTPAHPSRTLAPRGMLDVFA